MSNTLVLDLLRKIIKEKESEPLFERSTTLYYVIDSRYQSYSLDKFVVEYSQTKERMMWVKSLSICNNISLSLCRILENNDLPQKVIFIVDSIYEGSFKLHDLVRENQKIEDILNFNNFIIKNLEDIYQEAIKSGLSIGPKGTDFNQDSMDWWKNR